MQTKGEKRAAAQQKERTQLVATRPMGLPKEVRLAKAKQDHVSSLASVASDDPPANKVSQGSDIRASAASLSQAEAALLNQLVNAYPGASAASTLPSVLSDSEGRGQYFTLDTLLACQERLAKGIMVLEGLGDPWRLQFVTGGVLVHSEGESL